MRKRSEREMISLIVIPIRFLTDYNHLRRMLGYRPAVLEENEYLIHLKERIHNELGDFS